MQHDQEERAPILVVGATGTVGGAVVTELVQRGQRVRALLHTSPMSASPGPQVEHCTGDLGDPTSLERAFDGVKVALYVSPHADREVEFARNFLAAAQRAGSRVVFVGVHVSVRTWRGRLRHQVFRALFPAYRPKLRIGRMIEASRTAPTLLVPSNFFENDDLFLAEIADGRFPTPMRLVNRISVADIARAAATVMLDPGRPAGTHQLCGPRSWTGAECAAQWSVHLGRDVAYTGDDATAWSAVADRTLPAGRKGSDFRASFGLLGRLRMPTDAGVVVETARLLGRSPTTYEEFVARRAASLLAESPR